MPCSTSDKAPVLSYYRRSYSTLHDGKVIEHGDGFMLWFAGPDEVRETHGVSFEPVAFAEAADVLVGASKEIMSADFLIGWSDQKFTYEPEKPT